MSLTNPYGMMPPVPDPRMDVNPGGLVLLGRSVAASAVANFDFQNIPASFEDLVVMLMGRGDTAAATVTVLLRFNNDSGTNYDWQDVYGNGATAGAQTGVTATSAVAATIAAASDTTGAVGSSRLFVPCYARTVLRKTFFTTGFAQSGADGGATTTILVNYAAQWRSTAAVNRITLTPNAGNFITGSVCSLYAQP